MNKPNISWYISDGDEYTQDNEHYIGSFSPDTEVNLKAQVWNNRYGKNNISSIPNGRLVIFFESLEDSMLLNYCEVSINNSSFFKAPIVFNKCIVDLGLLSGNSNNGLDVPDNSHNFKDIAISFKKLPMNLKNGIKNMFLDIEMD